jgi:hypothetical protein
LGVLVSNKVRSPIVAGALASLFALFLLIATAYIGFLHEDAYILFIYSRHLAETGQISFDLVHGPTEGATDFLWMGLISLGVRLGVDPGFVAAGFNALGAGGLMWALCRVSSPARWQIGLLALMPLVLVSPFMGAALGGFSVLFYVGLYALALVALLEGRPHAAIAWSVLLCLTRPDGVLLSAGMLLPLLYRFRADRRVLLSLAAAVLVGVAYFIWRKHYFDEWLPLPLMVKSQGDSLAESLFNNALVLLPFAPLPWLYLRFGSRLSRFDLIGLLLPAAFLWVALALAHQSQNISYRFQAPIMASLLMVTVSLRLPSWRWMVLAGLPFVLFGLKTMGGEVRYLSRPAYSNLLPSQLQQMGLVRPGTRVALTEAGRMPYYLPAQYLDLVGLNSREVAVGGLTVAKIQAFQPSLIFLHHAGTYVPPVSDAPFVRVSRQAFLTEHWRPNTAKDPVMRAPSMVGDYLRQATHMDAVYFVRHGKSLFHVYVLDSRTVDPARFEVALQRSLTAAPTSHCAVSAYWPCRHP